MTNLLFTLLQAGVAGATEAKVVVAQESYLNLLMKGGWVLIPIFILQFVAIFVIIERWIVINQAKNKDKRWLAHTAELISDGKVDKAIGFCAGMRCSSARVVRAGIDVMQEGDMDEVQECMEMESRQEISQLELRMNYLGITAAIAPMLGFLGTIFGVIKIFYNISATNDLNISSISDGLYQKMICSGAGLFVGIVAYAGYYLLSGRIDRVVSQMEKDSNDVIRSIRQYKKSSK